MEEFDHHSIDEYGNVLNEKTGNILKPYVGSGGYLYVKPCENNITEISCWPYRWKCKEQLL